jgi:AraC family transcriptional regulator
VPHSDGESEACVAVTGIARIQPAEPTAKANIENAERNNPRWNFPLFRIEKTHCWGPISVHIVERAAGEAICRSDCYRLTYFLTDFQGTMEDDERPQWECQLLRGDFVFRPPGTTLRSNLTAGRYIQILQSPDTYNNLISEMVRGGAANLAPRYNVHDPLISQLVSTIANEVAGGLFGNILVDALNTALAVQITRICGDPAVIMLAPSNGLSRERLKRVYDYIEGRIDQRLSLTDLAAVSSLSPYHFSRSFKQTVGIGPQRYITQRRLERAKTLMRRTNLSLAEMAQEAGFADQSHLTSVFRRETGVTPGRFRVQ